MSRGLRVLLVSGLALGVSGLYGLHPDGIGLAWRLLLAYHTYYHALLLLSQLAIVGGCLWFAATELRAYWRWRTGLGLAPSSSREADWAVVLGRFGTPARAFNSLREALGLAVLELRTTQARAQRRWPRKRRELAGWLRAPWSRTTWAGVLLVSSGQGLIAGLCYRIPGYTLSPAQSLGATLVGLAVGNALVLLRWIAGDDDEGGPRRFPAAPQPPRFHKHPRALRPGLRVHRATRPRVPGTAVTGSNR